MRWALARTAAAISCIGKGFAMLSVFFLVLLVLLLIGALPTWPHSRNWGYYPSSGLGLVVVVVLVVLLLR
jgi:hypothetical protein